MVTATQLRQVQKQTLRSTARSLVLDALALTPSWGFKPSAPAVQFLLLHHVLDDELEGFRRLLRWIAERYEFVSYSEAASMLTKPSENSASKPRMAVSFDDGLHTCVRAAQMLEEYGARGCFFVCPGMVGERDPERVAHFCHERLAMPPMPLMDWNDLSELVNRGHEIGGHTMGHARLSELSKTELAFEIGECRRRLLAELGQLDHFAWPYGRLQDMTPAAVAEIYQTGYRTCASGMRGAHIAATSVDGRHPILRRESVVAGWPLRHTTYLLNRSRRCPLTPNATWPHAWRSAQVAEWPGGTTAAGSEAA